jgi:CDP-diacylglycerol--glycerol-3-phosphate 3-phosphatidyltransferase
MKFLHKIPLLLIYSRLVFAAVLLWLAIFKPSYYPGLIIVLMITGLLSDIFDGIIARRLNISTVSLRRLDTTVDLIFWLAIAVATYLLHPDFYFRNVFKILLIIGLEGIGYGVCLIKFRKEVATHAISSKLWTLIMFAALVQIVASGDSVLLFNLCFYTGILNKLEIIAMLLIIKKWHNDIPTVYHAVLLRKEKAIKRNKLFNG